MPLEHYAEQAQIEARDPHNIDQAGRCADLWVAVIELAREDVKFLIKMDGRELGKGERAKMRAIKQNDPRYILGMKEYPA